MINWLAYKLAKWLYVDRNREITKITPLEEFTGFLFTDSEATKRLIKAMLTAQTVRYFESTSEEVRNQIKGAAIILKVIVDANEEARNTLDLKETMEVKEKKWNIFKKFNRTN